MRPRIPEGFGLALLAPLILLPMAAWAAPAPTSSAPVPAESAKTTPPRATVLVLPVVSKGGGGWIAPWSDPGEGARFTPLEIELASVLEKQGYALVPLKEAMSRPAAAGALRSLPRPPPDEAAARAAREAGATLALVIQGEALRKSKDPDSKQAFTDALVKARAVRAADGVKLASAETRASGYGAGEREADAAALARAGRNLFDAMADPLSAAVLRPVIAAHPFTLYVEGSLRWGEYQRLLALLQHEIPEIKELSERRYAHGRQTLRVVCACEPWDITQRLDGRTAGGFALNVKSELTAVHVQARTLARETSRLP